MTQSPVKPHGRYTVLSHNAAGGKDAGGGLISGSRKQTGRRQQLEPEDVRNTLAQRRHSRAAPYQVNPSGIAGGVGGAVASENFQQFDCNALTRTGESGRKEDPMKIRGFTEIGAGGADAQLVCYD